MMDYLAEVTMSILQKQKERDPKTGYARDVVPLLERILPRLVEALQQGAQVVITGRVTDTGLTLAPIIHAFGWKSDAWDLLAAGTVAGHINECGAQCSGGNYLAGWPNVPGLEDVGYPIVEAR